MFAACTNLQKIYCENDWTQYSDQISLKHDVFNGCTSLKGGRGTLYDSSYAGKSIQYARPDGGPDAPGYFWKAGDDGMNHQGIDEIGQEPKAKSQKLIKDGQLLIERNGKTFNAQGVEVK